MKFKIITLGCKVNTYESNVMRDILLNAGYIEDEDADIYIINTCTVTNTSDNKSLKELRRIKREHPHAITIICGCMVQVRKDAKEIDADIILGNKDKSKIDEFIKEFIKTKNKLIYIPDIMKSPFELYLTLGEK